jgi:hypothetical protein
VDDLALLEQAAKGPVDAVANHLAGSSEAPRVADPGVDHFLLHGPFHLAHAQRHVRHHVEGLAVLQLHTPHAPLGARRVTHLGQQIRADLLVGTAPGRAMEPTLMPGPCSSASSTICQADEATTPHTMVQLAVDLLFLCQVCVPLCLTR